MKWHLCFPVSHLLLSNELLNIYHEFIETWCMVASLMPRLIGGVIGTILVRSIGTGMAFILSVFLARTLGADGFGIYSFVLSLLVFLSIPVQAGLPTLVVRETAKFHLAQNWLSIKKLFLWVVKIIALYLVLTSSLLGALHLLDLEWVGEYRSNAFIFGCILMFLVPLMLVQNALIRGLGRVVLGVIPEAIIRPGVTLIITSIIFSISKDLLTPVSAIASNVVSVLIAVCISLAIISKLWPKKGNGITVFNAIEIEKWKKTAYPLTVVGGLQLMYNHVDIIILGFFCENEVVGVYRAVGQLGLLVVFGLSAINQMLHSHFAKLYLENKMKELQELVTRSSIIIFSIAAFPAMIFLFAGEFVLNTIFGSEYISGVVPLLILTIGQLANAIFGSVGALLNMTGHEKYAMKGMLYSLVVNLVLSFVLIPAYGMNGAALSTALSLVVWNAILRNYVIKKLHIETIGLMQKIKKYRG